MTTYVSFRFKQTGFNAHTAKGKLGFPSIIQAEMAAKDIARQQGFSHVRVNRRRKRKA